jgi:hypothetical protein
MVLSVLDEQKGDDSCGHHDVAAFVSNLPAYPCCTLSKQRMLVSSGVIPSFGPDDYSRKQL